MDYSYLVALLLASGLNACVLNIANFLITKATSAVTMQVRDRLWSLVFGQGTAATSRPKRTIGSLVARRSLDVPLVRVPPPGQ